jgi:hypothetical protein
LISPISFAFFLPSGTETVEQEQIHQELGSSALQEPEASESTNWYQLPEGPAVSAYIRSNAEMAGPSGS